MPTDPEAQIPRQDPYWPLISLALVVVVLWVLCGIILYRFPERGTFGDMFGAVNALFSGLAFAGVIYAIYLQREELELQREELRSTRLELARSAFAQEKSEEALRQQVKAAEFSQRIAAINNMLEFAQECYRRLCHESIAQQEKIEIERWAARRFELIEELNKVYQQLFQQQSKASDPS